MPCTFIIGSNGGNTFEGNGNTFSIKELPISQMIQHENEIEGFGENEIENWGNDSFL